MPLTTAQQVRLRIQDPYRLDEEVRYGDGTASGFRLRQGAPHSTLISASAYLATTAGWSGTGSTFDLSLGQVKFSGVISALSAFRAEYQWSIFSDDEIAYFTAVGGSVAGAALEACRTLMFDALKRARWAAPDGTEYDDTKAQEMLVKMHGLLLEETTLAVGPQGGIESWSENQPYWNTEYGA